MGVDSGGNAQHKIILDTTQQICHKPIFYLIYSFRNFHKIFEIHNDSKSRCFFNCSYHNFCMTNSITFPITTYIGAVLIKHKK